MLAWIDLETTGLEPDRHHILEIAAVVTDDDLKVVSVGPNLVVWQPPEILDRMDDVAHGMHTRSGLLAEVARSRTKLPDAGSQVAAFFAAHLPDPKAVPMCGNTIGFDRSFLAVHLPGLDDLVHYRSVDVSTVKELVRRWAPQVAEAAPAKRKHHRSLDDILETIEELRYYRDSGFLGI